MLRIIISMSLSNLLDPNDYNLFCESINVDGVLINPSGLVGATGATGPTGQTGDAGPRGMTGPSGQPGSGMYQAAYGSWFMSGPPPTITNNAPATLVYDGFTGNNSQLQSVPVTYNSSSGLFTCTKNCIMNCYYIVVYQTPSNNGYRQIWIAQSNADSRPGLASVGSQAASGSIDNVSGSLSTVLSVGDTFRVQVFQNSGANQLLASFATSTIYTRMCATFVFTS